MPPKAAAAPAVAPIEKKAGAKVARVQILVAGEESLSVTVNLSCRVDILVDYSLTHLTKQFSARLTLEEAALASAKAIAAAQTDSAAAAPDGTVVDISAKEALVERLKTVSTTLSKATVTTVELIEVASSARVTTSNSFSSPASEIIRPSGIYWLALAAPADAQVIPI